jgi:hypothetical protein
MRIVTFLEPLYAFLSAVLGLLVGAVAAHPVLAVLAVLYAGPMAVMMVRLSRVTGREMPSPPDQGDGRP